MSRFRSLALGLGLWGCHGPCPPLGHVPVQGSDTVRDTSRAVLAELEAFLRLPVCIREVRGVEDVPWGGRYDPTRQRVSVTEGQPASYLTSVVRHEVCHGVDLQNDLVRDDPERWDLPLVGVTDGTYPPEHEAFAQRCGALAPAEAVLAWPSDCGDGAWSDGIEDLRDVLYGGPSVAEVDLGPAERWVEGPVEGSVSARCVVEGVELAWRGGGSLQRAVVDVPPGDCSAPLQRPAGAWSVVPLDGEGAWLPDGRVALLARFREGPTRLLVGDDAGWGAVPICPSPRGAVVSKGVAAWLIEPDGSGVVARRVY